MKEKIIYKGHITLKQVPYLGRMFDVIESKNAAAIMYIDPEDNVYLTNQFRVPLGAKVLGLPAETLDKPGISSLDVIVDGLEEECGVKISKEQVHHFASVESSGGHDTEIVDLFYAYGPHVKTEQRLEDTEKIDVVKIPFSKVYDMIATGEMRCSKSIMLLQHEYVKRLEQKLGS